MEILVNVIGQKLKIATNLKCFISGSQQFVKFIFNMDDSWDNLTTFAQFRQNDVAYNQYLDANKSVYLPREIGAGACTLILYGTGGNVRATTNYLTLTIDENILVTNAQSTEITQSLYEQLVNSVTTTTNRLQDRVANVENVIQGLAGGAPIVVSSVSEMTDTAQIYVLSTDGNWYYHNGATWVAGGEYGAVATDRTLTQSGIPADAETVGDALARKVSTVNGVEPDETGNVTVSAGGGIDSDGITKLIEILNEGLYGTNQSDNIVLLNNILRGHSLVSISATYDGAPPFVGTPYDELDFTVTATYSDSSTAILSTYMVSSGTVVEGTNTVTISFGGMSTTVTFTGSSVRTYSITYNLAGVTSSNNATLVAENDSYSSVLSAMPDYTFSACTVTMDGTDVTSTVYSNQEILITEVTGNVVITASAIQNVYLDALIPAASGALSVSVIYSDYFTTQMGRVNYHGWPYVTEYPFANASRLKWTLTNTSEESVNIGGLYLGCLPSDDSNYRANMGSNVLVTMAYGVKITNNNNTLGAGSSLTGYYDVRAGYQLAFLSDNQIHDSIELKLQGEYTPMSLSGYTKIQSTEQIITCGAYRKVTWYSDAGVTAVGFQNGQKFNVFNSNLSAGTYDVIIRAVSPDGSSFGAYAGAVDISNTAFTEVNNSAGVLRGVLANVFYGGLRLVVADSSYTIIRPEGGISDTKYMELYVKEVTS